MKKILISLVFLMVMFLGLNGGTISGLVQVQGDSYGNCLVEAFVELVDAPVASCYTSNDGSYQLSDLGFNTYFVRAGAEDNWVVPEYYDGVDNILQATPIVLNENNPDAVDINFDLEATVPVNIVSGTVFNEDGEPVSGAHVNLLCTNPWIDYYDVTDANGEFSYVNIQSGVYSLQIDAYGYNDYVYPDQLPIWEGSSYEDLVIVLTSVGIFELTGTVRDAQTGLPIEHANVSTISDSMVFYTDSDANGEYSLYLPAGQFQVYAQRGEMYGIQYYDHVNSPLDAEIIEVNGDIGGIDFDLVTQNQNYDNFISGMITDSGEPPLYQVMAVAVSSDQDWVETAEVTASGYYQLANLPSNEYYVIAVSAEAPPTYYNDVLDFEDATPVVIANSSVEDIDIHLNSSEGYGVLNMSGFVSDSNDNPVSNTAVIFLGSDGNVANFALTNSDGFYEVPNLTMDNYQVIATKIFYESDIENISVNDNGYADFQINSLSTESPKNEIQPAIGLISNYPNPFLNATTISFELSAQEMRDAKVEIYNIKGQKIRTLSAALNGDETKTSIFWDGTDKSGKQARSGMYFYKVKTVKKSYTKKMIKIR